jgi:hypothetical protein
MWPNKLTALNGIRGHYRRRYAVRFSVPLMVGTGTVGRLSGTRPGMRRPFGGWDGRHTPRRAIIQPFGPLRTG